MRRVLLILVLLLVSVSVSSVAFAQDDPNACLTGGSMEGQCDLPTDAEDEWAWTCGYYVGLYDEGEISRDQIPDWCYFQEGGDGGIVCFNYYLVDIGWVGPVNTFNNVAFYSSNDGSCSGTLLTTLTVVQAGTQPEATGICTSISAGFTYAVPLPPDFLGTTGGLWGCSFII